MMKGIKFILFLAAIILFSCNEKSTIPVIPDDNEIYIENDSSLINIKEHFKGSILGNQFDWVENINSRQSYHGGGSNTRDGITYFSYCMGMNTKIYKDNDYIIYIYSPWIANNDFLTVLDLFSPGVKNLTDYNHEYGSGFLINVFIIDETTDSNNVVRYRSFSSSSGTQKNCYIKILSRVVTEKDGYYHIKLKMKLLCNLYDNSGTLAGTLNTNDMVCEVYFLIL